ncbi:MAG: hypothetical protein ACKOYC_09330 [Bacteroidota bacterium]
MADNKLIEVEIPYWSSVYNHIVYSFFYYSERNGFDLKIVKNNDVYLGLAIINFKGKRALLDYSDDTGHFNGRFKCDYYFKRSLMNSDYLQGVFPLNFQISLSYKPLKVLSKIEKSILFDKRSRGELIRALDWLETFTDDSHHSKTIMRFDGCRALPKKSGRVIFMTRLWDPSRHADEAEKARREAQNNFRIGACRILKKEFPDSIVGVFPDNYSKTVATDVLIDASLARKRSYLNLAGGCDIGIADDGLRDTPGWKIGEYTMLGMAIISTPINVHIQGFTEGVNYLSTGSRSNYEVLPALISTLQRGDRYLEMQKSNRNWYLNHLEPLRYVDNILSKFEN